MFRNESASLAKVTIYLSQISRLSATDFFQQWHNFHGIEFLQVELKKQRIVIHYDVLHVSLVMILDSIRSGGMVLKGGLFYRWRLSLAKNVELNIQDNLNHVPHCCGKAPSKILMKK